MKKLVTLVALMAFVSVACDTVASFDCQNDACNNLVLNYKYVENTTDPADLDVVCCAPCAVRPNAGATLNGCPTCAPCGGWCSQYTYVGDCKCPKAPKTTKCPWFRINKAWARGFDNMCAAPSEVTQCAFMGSASLPILGFVWGAGEGVFIGVCRFMAGLFDCLTFGCANNAVYDGLGVLPAWNNNTWYKLPPVFGTKCDKPAAPAK